MFSRNSRYANLGPYTIRTARGTVVTATRLPIRDVPPVRGVHPRTDDQRPDHLAAHFLADATSFWRLCDANETIAPDALAARERIAIPKKDS
jgi:hypothetical protein